MRLLPPRRVADVPIACQAAWRSWPGILQTARPGSAAPWPGTHLDPRPARPAPREIEFEAPRERSCGRRAQRETNGPRATSAAGEQFGSVPKLDASPNHLLGGWARLRQDRGLSAF